jgi:hypothetical protein
VWQRRPPHSVIAARVRQRSAQAGEGGGVGCGVWGVGCGVWGVGCGVWGVGCGVWGVGWVGEGTSTVRAPRWLWYQHRGCRSQGGGCGGAVVIGHQPRMVAPCARVLRRKAVAASGPSSGGGGRRTAHTHARMHRRLARKRAGWTIHIQCSSAAGGDVHGHTHSRAHHVQCVLHVVALTGVAVGCVRHEHLLSLRRTA